MVDDFIYWRTNFDKILDFSMFPQVCLFIFPPKEMLQVQNLIPRNQKMFLRKFKNFFFFPFCFHTSVCTLKKLSLHFNGQPGNSVAWYVWLQCIPWTNVFKPTFKIQIHLIVCLADECFSQNIFFFSYI